MPCCIDEFSAMNRFSETGIVAAAPMSSAAESAPRISARPKVSAESAAFWILVGTIAWAPFPLGSNRMWSAVLLSVLISLSWTSWVIAIWTSSMKRVAPLRPVRGPLVLLLLPIVWGFIQIAPFAPAGWIHPLWRAAADTLGHPVSGAISISPWRTGTSLMKLISCGMAAWLSYAFSQSSTRAAQLLKAVIATGAFYGAYALVMAILGVQQFQLFYPYQPRGQEIASPFVLHNSFATYMGLACICVSARLFAALRSAGVTGSGAMRKFFSTVQYLFGDGLLDSLCLLLTSSMLIASGSRAGFLATLTGIFVVLILALARGRDNRWNLTALLTTAAVAVGIFALSGQGLENRFADLIVQGQPDETRLSLWSAGLRMISSSPWLGLGLGSFEPGYPIFAHDVFALIMDKAHNDYLELAADWGVFAVALWCAGIAWAGLICARGSIRRRRNWAYPLAGAGATALIAFHSAFDFSLQIPAVAVTYSAIMGLGLAQSFSRRRSQTQNPV